MDDAPDIDAGLPALLARIPALPELAEDGRPEPATFEEEDAETRRLLALLADAGALRFVVPAAHGGARETVRCADVAAIREAIAGLSGLADSAFVMQGLGSAAIARRGATALQSEWLPRIADGSAAAAIALTEPGAGSDLSAIAARARRDGTAYVLDGEKTLITNAGLAAVYTLFARTSDDPRRGITAFLLEASDPGLTVSGRFRAMAPHPLGSLRLDGCRVPAARRIGEEGEGLAIAFGVLNFFRPTVGAAAIGFARRALRETVAHVKRRVQFGEPLAERPGLRAIVADMATRIEAAALLVARAAADVDTGAARTARSSAMAKYFATETAGAVADAAVQLHGGLGVVRGAAVERIYREVRALRIYEGASEVQRGLIAREILRDVSGGGRR